MMFLLLLKRIPELYKNNAAAFIERHHTQLEDYFLCEQKALYIHAFEELRVYFVLFCFFSWRLLINNKCKERSFLWTPFTCLKTDSQKKNSIAINSLSSSPQDFHQHGKIDWFQERRLEVPSTPRQTLSHTVISPTYSRNPFIFPENYLLSPKWSISTLPFSYQDST